jgi:hypothetical protein
MQVNKLQFGQSNYKLDQISLELILSNLNPKRDYLFTVAKEKGTKFKTIEFTRPEKRLYELELKPANSQTGFQPTFNIIYDSIFNFPTTSIINSSESILKWKRHTLDSQYSLFGIGYLFVVLLII